MNSSNETFYSLDYWLSLYGYPYITEVFATYIITPIWLLSLMLSIFSLFILRKAPFFASNFFNYMRLYVSNCLILSVISLTTIFVLTRRLFAISNTYEAVFFDVYVNWLIANSLTLFSSCIEICLVMEKILYLLPSSFKRIKLISFKKFFFALFLACILVNLSGMFLFETGYADIKLDPNAPLFRLWLFVPTSFSFSQAGRVFSYLGYICRDILPMILKIAINMVSIYLVGNYVKNKQRIRAAMAARVDSHIANFDRRQTYIAFIMNTFSLLEHMLNIAAYVLFFISDYQLTNMFIMLALLVIAIKHSFVFFILLLFNNLFRNEVRKCFKRRRIST